MKEKEDDTSLHKPNNAVGYYHEPERSIVPSPVNQLPTINLTPKKTVNEYIQDTDEYVEEESLSLDEVEKEMIKKALERHHGRRKLAAKDLNISERTLYRKIKEYDLE